MSQYKTGTVSVTNGSKVVTGTGTAWLSNVQPGDGFTVAGTQVPYTVGSVDSDGQITLSAAYAGPSGSGLAYAIWRDFTTNENLPELSHGDIETATIWTRALRLIDALVGAATTTNRGTVEKATTSEAKQAVADKYPDAAGVHAAFNQYGLGSPQEFLEVDADTLTNPGFYYLAGAATNLPDSSPHRVIVYGGAVSGSPRLGQIAAEWDSNRTYSRFLDNSGVWSPWVKQYNQESVLGTVSQSGGVPTGAIIERGSNANGEYVKYADGSLICKFVKSIDFSSVVRTDCTPPAPFAGFEASVGGFTKSGVLSDSEREQLAGVVGTWSSAAGGQIRVWNPVGTLNTDVYFQAIGRWY